MNFPVWAWFWLRFWLRLYREVLLNPRCRQLPVSTMSVTPSKINSQDRSDVASLRSSGLMVVPEDFAKLTLAPGFLLSLSVLDDPDLVGTFRIDQHGDLSLPILGTIHVAGETTSEARVQIQYALLKNQILNDPQVNLTVLEIGR